MTQPIGQYRKFMLALSAVLTARIAANPNYRISEDAWINTTGNPRKRRLVWNLGIPVPNDAPKIPNLEVDFSVTFGSPEYYELQERNSKLREAYYTQKDAAYERAIESSDVLKHITDDSVIGSIAAKFGMKLYRPSKVYSGRSECGLVIRLCVYVEGN